MIEVKIPMNYRLCQCCGEQAFREYVFRREYQGTEIALCRRCVGLLNAMTNFPVPRKEQDDEP